MDSVIDLLNNWGLVVIHTCQLLSWSSSFFSSPDVIYIYILSFLGFITNVFNCLSIISTHGQPEILCIDAELSWYGKR